jgi:hypothetical protein
MDITLKHVGWLLLGIAAMMGVFWVSRLPFSDFEAAAKVAPLATAVIALLAAVIALIALFIQRDTARRRAAIDFFLKTEMDNDLIDAYNDFNDLAPQIAAIISRPTLSKRDDDYKKLIKWLNICELIAVGVNLGAFSERVSYDYWGYILPDALQEGWLFIQHVRNTPDLGGPETFSDLQKLCHKWGRHE